MSRPLAISVVLTLFVLLILGTGSARVGAEERDELTRARDGHQATRDTMQTLSYQLAIKKWESKEVIQTVEGWRTATSLRVKTRHGGTGFAGPSTDVIVANDRQVTLAESAGKPAVGTRSIPQGRASDDVFGYAMLVFFGPKGRWFTFEELLAQPHEQQRADRVVEEGREYLVVGLKYDSTRIELWFDPSVNYLVRRQVVIAQAGPKSGSEQRSEIYVHRFQEVSPSVFFPEFAELTVATNGTVSLHTSRTFTNVRINDPIASDQFVMRYPPGTEVTDDIEKRVYRAGPDGALTLLTGKQVAGDVPPLQRADSMTDADSSTYQTSAEPRPASRWILPAAAAVLALAGIVWGVRRWVRRRAEVI
jgi:outer membrane lipoprotein-sorting protein